MMKDGSQHRMKKVFVLIGLIVLLVLAALVFLFSIGTVFPGLPFIDSVANIVTVGYAHLTRRI